MLNKMQLIGLGGRGESGRFSLAYQVKCHGNDLVLIDRGIPYLRIFSYLIVLIDSI